jgi:TolB-like protein
VNVFGELKQRKVLQSAALYFAVAWGATEILSFLIERIPVFPAWTETAIAILFVLGFPVTVFLAWMFDIGKDGVRRADPASGLGRGMIVLSIGGLLLATAALSYLLLPKIEAEKGRVHKGDLGTVAVLPLENLTGDPSLGYLGAGLAEDIRQRLMAQTDLKIIGRVSMTGFSGGGSDLSSLRSMLDAGHVLEGSLQQAAGKLQVVIALLDTATSQQLWSNTFMADWEDWESVRQRIVASLAEQLELTVRVRQTEARVPNKALEAYLRGLAALQQPEVADSWFAEAVRIAPEFADAWARRALLRVDMIWRDQSVFQAWDEAEPMFTRAREIDPDNLLADIAEAHLLWLAKLDPTASFEVLKGASERAPNHPMVLAGLSTAFCFIADRHDDAVAYARRYVAQDPLSPDAHNRLGLALHFNNQNDQALRENQRAIDLDPGFNRAWDYRANWQYYGNRQADAMVTLTRKARLENPARGETVRCKLQVAGSLLPDDRAVPLLEDAIQRGLGMTEAHWWCSNPMELLLQLHLQAGRDAEAEQAKRQLEKWLESSGAVRTDLLPFFAKEELPEHCKNELCRLRASLGDEAFESWLGPNPPLQYFNFQLAAEISTALISAGRVEEGRRLAALAAPVAREFAGPKGHPTTTTAVVHLYALSGDIDTALNYAEQVGPEGFYMFGMRANFGLSSSGAPGKKFDILDSNSRWMAFMERCEARWLKEVQKFDELMAGGEILLP